METWGTGSEGLGHAGHIGLQRLHKVVLGRHSVPPGQVMVQNLYRECSLMAKAVRVLLACMAVEKFPGQTHGFTF